MLMVAPNSSTCRKCGVPTEKGEHISWADGPYHLACTPLRQDWDEAKVANFFRDTPKASPSLWTRGEFSIVLLATLACIATLVWAMVSGSPYSYFIFLRCVVCAASILFVVLFLHRNMVSWAYGFGFLAVLFNPILRVTLTRSIWLILDFATIVAFAVAFYLFYVHGPRVARGRADS